MTFYYKITFCYTSEMWFISYGYVYSCTHTFSFRPQLKNVAFSTPEKRPLFQDFKGRLLKVSPKAREKRPLRL